MYTLYFILFYFIFVCVVVDIVRAKPQRYFSCCCLVLFIFPSFTILSLHSFNVVWFGLVWFGMVWYGCCFYFILFFVIQRRILSNNTLWHRTQKGQTFTWIFIKYSVATVLLVCYLFVHFYGILLFFLIFCFSFFLLHIFFSCKMQITWFLEWRALIFCEGYLYTDFPSHNRADQKQFAVNVFFCYVFVHINI